MKKNSPTSTVAIMLAALVGLSIISGAFFLMRGKSQSATDQGSVPNTQILEGKQIITIKAKGGYQPRKSIAKAGIPTILRIDTKGTFDCSSSVRIPSLNISTVLPQTGTTDINLGTPASGVLQGTCGMGMYPFEIDFQE